MQPIATNGPSGLFAASQPAQAAQAAAGLGKDDFLKLLVAQLQHQDPMNPMQDREFITQLAQFNALEQMQQMNKTIESFAATQDVIVAAGLLGKTVEYIDATGAVATGQVSRVAWDTGTPKLSVGNEEVDLVQIISQS